MKDRPSQSLDRFNSHSDVSTGVSGDAKVLEAKRSGMTIRVTVVDGVLEWFVDVLDGTTVVVEGWCDYQGYDDTPGDELADSMALDIEEFVSKLLSREIRLATARPTRIEEFVSKLFHRDVRFFAQKRTLEWMVNGSWEQALPFS